MANEQGRYVGETIIGVIGEDVGLGQVLYCSSSPAGTPYTTGAWYVASADGDYLAPHGWISGQNQLGISLTAASASPITTTQSGTEIPILLSGYYSPGVQGGGGYCLGNLLVGGPMWLAPKNVMSDNTSGMIDGNTPVYHGATQGVYRIVGYCYDEQTPFVIRFEPDKTWIGI